MKTSLILLLSILSLFLIFEYVKLSNDFDKISNQKNDTHSSYSQNISVLKQMNEKLKLKIKNIKDKSLVKINKLKSHFNKKIDKLEKETVKLEKKTVKLEKKTEKLKKEQIQINLNKPHETKTIDDYTNKDLYKFEDSKKNNAFEKSTELSVLPEIIFDKKKDDIGLKLKLETSF